MCYHVVITAKLELTVVDAVVQMCMYAEENRHHYHHLHEKPPHVLGIVIITTIHMYLFHSYMHFHVRLCFLFVAIIMPLGPYYHHGTTFDPWTWIWNYGFACIQCLTFKLVFSCVLHSWPSSLPIWL